MLLVGLLVIRPLLRAMKREPAGGNGEDEAAPRLPGLAPTSPAAEASGAEQALLGKQVELAQRLVDEKP